MLERILTVVTGLSSIALFLFAYAFAPWPHNLFGGVEIAGVPIWLACLTLALGLIATTVHVARAGRSRRVIGAR